MKCDGGVRSCKGAMGGYDQKRGVQGGVLLELHHTPESLPQPPTEKEKKLKK